jgi:hypothetical protein
MMYEIVPLEDNVNYLSNFRENRNMISYVPPDSYLERQRQEKRNLLKFLPATHLKRFPKNGNEWILGWTYRNKDGSSRTRDDLVGKEHLRVQVHEDIHTPNEYETRRWEEEIMETMFPTKEKYQTKPKNYLF